MKKFIIFKLLVITFIMFLMFITDNNVIKVCFFVVLLEPFGDYLIVDEIRKKVKK